MTGKPGARMSGLTRPSAAGPRDENAASFDIECADADASGASGSCAETAPPAPSMRRRSTAASAFDSANTGMPIAPLPPIASRPVSVFMTSSATAPARCAADAFSVKRQSPRAATSTAPGAACSAPHADGGSASTSGATIGVITYGAVPNVRDAASSSDASSAPAAVRTRIVHGSRPSAANECGDDSVAPTHSVFFATHLRDPHSGDAKQRDLAPRHASVDGAAWSPSWDGIPAG